MKEKIKAWVKDIKEHKFKICIALVLYITALIFQQIAYEYVKTAPTTEVRDIILDSIKPIDLNFIYFWLFAVVVVILLVYPLIFKPNKIHYYFGLFALLIFVRSLFIVLTHLQNPGDAVKVTFPWIFNILNVENDLFFSGHVAVPFLGYLMIDNKLLKYFMLVSSIAFGITVLFMHIHYTIDVLAAFFITYGTYKIGNKIFK